jgi:protein-tyrosine phosphatase
LSYDLAISRNPDFDDALILRDLPEPSAEVLHLYIATRYYWKVIVKRSGQALTESATWSFTTDSTPPRWIRVPGTTNVRDMGGWPLPGDRIVRQGVLYRGSELNGHIQIVDEGKSVLVEELGIRTDLDLRRSTDEAEPALDQRLVEWINIPTLHYHHMLEEEGKDSLRKVFQVFAEASNYPILFHCWGGADRTGTVAFLLHALLGVSKENLIHDYELTSLCIWGRRSRSYWKFQRMLEMLTPANEGSNQLAAQVAAYLLSIGVSQEAIAAIRALLVVDREDR